MKQALIIVGILVLAAGIAFAVLVPTRNELVSERETVNREFGNVDVQLQRRADLIPNLVETVKGYAKQEKEIFEAVANARAAMLNARTPQEKIQAGGQMDSAIGRLLAIAEAYPQLKSNENFLRLQDELAGTENRLQNARRSYNEAVQNYNKDLQLFPKNIAATLFSFQAADYYRADAASRNAPKVQF